MRGQASVVAAAIVIPLLLAAVTVAVLKWQQMVSVEELIQASENRIAYAAEMPRPDMLVARSTSLVLVQTPDGQLLLRRASAGETLMLPLWQQGWIMVGPAAKPLTDVMLTTSIGNFSTSNYLDPLFLLFNNFIDVNQYRGCYYLGPGTQPAWFNVSSYGFNLTTAVGTVVLEPIRDRLGRLIALRLIIDGIVAAEVYVGEASEGVVSTDWANVSYVLSISYSSLVGYIPYANVNITSRDLNVSYVSRLVQLTSNVYRQVAAGNITLGPLPELLMSVPHLVEYSIGSTTTTATIALLWQRSNNATAFFEYDNYYLGSTRYYGIKVASNPVEVSKVVITFRTDNSLGEEIVGIVLGSRLYRFACQ